MKRFLHLCLTQYSVTVKRPSDQQRSYKRKHLTGGLQFQGLLHYCRGREYGAVPAASGSSSCGFYSWETYSLMWAFETLETHFLQHVHTS